MAFCIAWQNLRAIPSQIEGHPVDIIGNIASIPEKKLSRTRFLLKIDPHENQQAHFKYSTFIRCSWENAPPLKVGDQWRLKVTLKNPHTPINPGGFDYEAWLFAHKISATCSVQNAYTNLKLSESFFIYQIDRLRQNLAARINNTLYYSDTKGLIKALVVGDQSDILEDQWKVLRQTGTNHLFAIAGLHIGFIAHLVYQIATACAKRTTKLALHVPAQIIGASSALCAAVIYSALAGFSLPTKRAIIMLAVFLVAKIRHRNVNAWNSWSIALGILLVLNPLQILTESFWLSFTAVGSLIYGFTGRINPHKKFTAKLMHGIRTQWITSIALIPLSLLLFQQASLVGFFANFIAIPWIGFFIAPLSLLSGLFLIPFPWLGNGLLKIADFSLNHFWPILKLIGSWPNSQWYQVILTPWVLISGSTAILLLLAPKGFPGQLLAFIWILPLIFYLPQQSKYNLGEMDFTLLDVGQGLSAVIRTRQHTLVFDTGARYKNFFDAGESILLPFMRFFQIKRIDTLVVSHGDNDHIGGSSTLLQNLPVSQVITSVPERFPSISTIRCIAGQRWWWDGVKFEMLYPPLGNTLKGNNSSCVLKITSAKYSLLLTGDIEKEAEKILLQTAFHKLPAHILVAPHHGSKTSSTEEFIHAISPRIVLFPVGYLNQYHLPAPLIVQRYQQAGAQTYDSVHCGAINIRLAFSQTLAVHCYREENPCFWRKNVTTQVVIPSKQKNL